MQILLVFSAGEIPEEFRVVNFIHIHLNSFRFILAEIMLSLVPQLHLVLSVSYWYSRMELMTQ